MNCIIIEDESNATEYLEYQLNLSGNEMEVLARIRSVKKAVEWLRLHETDLIFLDVQLSDGLSFEIFDHVQVTTPVIFTTSFDQYLTKAFEVNSISYILKPVKLDHLKSALIKYKLLYDNKISLSEKMIPLTQGYQRRFLVESGSNFKSLLTSEISYFHVQTGRYLILVTKSGEQYLIENTLERLEQRLDPSEFFRINRQFIINISAITNMTAYDRGRLKIETTPECKEEMIVVIHKAQAFKDWLNR